MKRRFLGCLAAMSLLTLGSCIDKNYDLSDTDTTSKVNVENLTIPLNIENLELSSIIKVDDSDPNATVKLVNGEYCLVETGTFKSSSVNVGRVTLNCAEMRNPEPKDFDASKGAYPPVWDPSIADNIDLTVGTSGSNFTLATNSVPSCVKEISEVGSNLKIEIHLGLQGVENIVSGFRMHGYGDPNAPFTLYLPKGLKEVKGPGTYNSQTGDYVIPSTDFSGTSASMTINVGRVDFSSPDIQFDTATHSIRFTGNIRFSDNTQLLISKDNLPKTTTQLPDHIYYYTNCSILNLDLTSLTGEIVYDDINIPDARIMNLPDLFAQNARIRLDNPQIYLSLYNPFYDKNVYASTELEISPIRGGAPAGSYNLDSPLKIEQQKEANYLLCPKPASVSSPYLNYPGAFASTGLYRQQYSGLGDILYGDRLPDALRIKINDTSLKVKDFAFGQEIPAITGTYCFFVPLQLDEGSMLVYEGVTNDWSDDIQDVEISLMSVSTVATSDVPLAFTLHAYPIDKEGNRLPGVSESGVTIPANASEVPLTFSFEGDMTGIDGIKYTATVIASDGGETLSDAMRLSLKDFKVTVSGSYTTDF